MKIIQLKKNLLLRVCEPRTLDHRTTIPFEAASTRSLYLTDRDDKEHAERRLICLYS